MTFKQNKTKRSINKNLDSFIKNMNLIIYSFHSWEIIIEIEEILSELSVKFILSNLKISNF